TVPSRWSAPGRPTASTTAAWTDSSASAADGGARAPARPAGDPRSVRRAQGLAVEIVLVGIDDPHPGELPDAEPRRVVQDHAAVDLRRVRWGAREKSLPPLGVADTGIDQDLDLATDEAPQAPFADARPQPHEAAPALLAELLRHMAIQGVRARALDRRIGEASDAIELGLRDELEQVLELLLCFAGKPGDERAADREVGADRAPLADPFDVRLTARRPLHRAQDAGMGMLERHVQVGKHLALGHQFEHLVHVRIGIDVVQADPGAELAQLARELPHAGPDGAAAHESGAVPHIHPIGAGVLRDDEELAATAIDQGTRLAQHVADGPAHQVSPQRRDDAEAAPVVAALGDLEIRVVPRGQAHA